MPSIPTTPPSTPPRKPPIRTLSTTYSRQLIALCAKTPAFVYGDFKDLDPNHPQIFLYTRPSTGDQYLVIRNFSSQPIDYTLPDNMKASTMLLANYPSHENSSTILHLKGWEYRIYKQ